MNKQRGSRFCFVCGRDNPIGLHLVFHEDDQGRVIARFTPGEAHQGYPGVLHGGITCALLDETIGRTLVSRDLWAMTADLRVRFRKPIPLNETLTVYGELGRLRSRTMEGRGRIELEDGSVAATAEAKYIILSEEKVAQFKEELPFWRVDGEQT